MSTLGITHKRDLHSFYYRGWKGVPDELWRPTPDVEEALAKGEAALKASKATKHPRVSTS